MGKKYLDTKESSLESSILGVWETAIGEREEGFDGRTSKYKSHRSKLETARVRRENKKLKKEDVELDEATGDKEAYQKFFQKTLKKFGVKSPAELKGDKKKKFFDAIDAGWEGDNEKKEELALDEGRMSDLHLLIKQGKSAEEIAKIMKVDVKTIKALMASYEQMVPESFEIGTEKYLKHTVETTPGQKEWTEVVTKKANSMRETLAKMWKVDEGKNVFAKEAKKDLTNAAKGGKTMTGKKISPVDTSPSIKEKR